VEPIPRPGIDYDVENVNKNQDRNQANSFLFHDRKIRSAALNDTELSSQFERYCSGAGSQPCTCYYPDFPNITQFELSIDDATKNASGINGTGPGTCNDLRAIGHSLTGFYLVRFNSKRPKAIICDFSETNKKSVKTLKTYPKEDGKSISYTKTIRMCGAVRNQPCSFYYSDYPDAPQFKGNDTSIENITGPTNCEDLKLIGHRLNGFYLVRINALKVKITYCDFNKAIEKSNSSINHQKFKSSHEEISSKRPKLCYGVGSQPCSCYYSNFPKILQFELSNDEITKNTNGMKSCEDLESSGYTLKGFYMVRYNASRMRTIFCDFYKPKIKAENGKKSAKLTSKQCDKNLCPYIHFNSLLIIFTIFDIVRYKKGKSS